MRSMAGQGWRRERDRYKTARHSSFRSPTRDRQIQTLLTAARWPWRWLGYLPSTVDDLNRCRHNRFPSLLPTSPPLAAPAKRKKKKKKKEIITSKSRKAVLVTPTAADGKGPSLLRQLGTIIAFAGLFPRLAHLPPVGGGAKTPCCETAASTHLPS